MMKKTLMIYIGILKLSSYRPSHADHADLHRKFICTAEDYM